MDQATSGAGRPLFIGLVIFAIVSDWMWEKLRSDHTAVYPNPISDG